MAKFKVSLAQMNVVAGDIKGNKAQLHEMTAEAVRRKSDMVIFPELFITGYVLDEAEKHADTVNEGMFAELSALAVEGNLAISGSIMEKRDEGVTNSMVFYSANGTLQGIYRKMHLFRLFDEDKYLAQGNQPLTLDLDPGKTGLAICYDLRFPEIFRRYAITDDAKIIMLCAEWPLVRVEHWRALLIARAIENQCFIIACNAAGDTGDAVMAGHSIIIDPWGRIVVEAGETPQLITAELDLEEVDRARSKIPVFDDLRHDIYSY